MAEKREEQTDYKEQAAQERCLEEQEQKKRALEDLEELEELEELEQQELDMKLLRKLTGQLEKIRISDYVMLMQRPWRIFWLNFAGGVARGLGFAVGFTILGALLIYSLRLLGVLDLPVIGDFIAELVNIVQMQLESRY